MRPPGEVRQALLEAAHALASLERGATMRELAAHAQVGVDAAKYTVQHMTRSGVLKQARRRPVRYRNKPVAEYVPAGLAGGPADELQAPEVALSSFWERLAPDVAASDLVLS